VIDKRVETTKNVTIKLTGTDILIALVDAGHIDMPDTFTCVFEVPGGGDYSNTSVNIDEDAQVVITFKEKG